MKRWSFPFIGLLVGFAAASALLGSWLHGQPAPPNQPPALPRELTSYRDVVKRVLPAVVSIETRAKPKFGVKLKPQFVDDPNLPEEFRRPPGGPADPNRLMAQFGLANCLLLRSAGQDARTLREALGLYEEVLKAHGLNADLASAARHNRERARLLRALRQSPAACDDPLRSFRDADHHEPR